MMNLQTNFEYANSSLLQQDLAYIFEQTQPLWEELKNRCIFITGGTGFFGQWLLESFCWINKKLALNAKVVVLTRSAANFAKNRPDLFYDKALQFHEGNILNFQYPEGPFYCVIHAAADGGVKFKTLPDFVMLETIVQGTKHTLEFAKQCRAEKILFISSGAVYGKRNSVSLVNELAGCQLDPIHATSAYALGKLHAEYLCSLYAQHYSLPIKIARCFASVGPYLPLDVHFAIGNFIKNKLNNETIIIRGDGTPYRAYLYIAELCVWLWTILFKGKILTPYNVGSDEGYSLQQIASLVANAFEPKVQVKIIQKPDSSQIPERYIPDIMRAREDLHLVPKLGLVESIQKTIHFYQRLTNELNICNG
jgi:nucleoside-diphosphate-sugar epimerase